MDPAISVVVPARDAAATLERTLRALAAQDTELPYEVIVVDDGSRDGTAAIAERAGPPVRLIGQPRAGAAAARNAGVAEGSADLLAFTDADCFPDPGWLREGIAALEQAELVQGRVLPDPADPPGPFDHTVWVPALSALFETANLFARRELFARLGGFEEPLGVRAGRPFGEDVWFGWRARRAGARVSFAERALVHHAVLYRGPAGYVAERLRLHYFCGLVRLVPELRSELLRGRLFLTAGTARFDLALAGLIAARLTGRRAALLAALPYAMAALATAAPHGRNGPRVALANALADTTGLAALLAGSIRWRSPVL